MFDFVHKKKRIVQIILGLATLPFLFWGIESYRSAGGEDHVASAAGEKISPQEFEQALRNQQESMRATLGANFNEAMLERPEVRAAVLEGLIQQRLLKHEAARVGLSIADPQLVEMIQNISAFQEDGKFSKKRYEELLRGQGMSPRVFEARVRQELMRQQLIAPYSEHGFVPGFIAATICAPDCVPYSAEYHPDSTRNSSIASELRRSTGSSIAFDCASLISTPSRVTLDWSLRAPFT